MARPLELIVTTEYEHCRLSTFLRRTLGAGTALLQTLKKDETAVLLNGFPSFLNVFVRTGDVVSVRMPETFAECGREATVAPIDLGIGFCYEDDDYVVMAKPAGMPVHPSRAHVYDTLANDFCFRRPDMVFRPLTRLDYDTSGLVLVAKNKLAATVDRTDLTRIYYGITDRVVCQNGGVCDAPIAREVEGEPKRCVRADGKPAVTHWRVVARKGALTLLRFRLETGRTHQIRVHCAFMGFPLCGDTLYGGSGAIERQALHATYLAFSNRVSGKRTTVKAPLPTDLRRLWEDFSAGEENASCQSTEHTV